MTNRPVCGTVDAEQTVRGIFMEIHGKILIADDDPEKKAAEIFEILLGENFYEDLKANGYEFRQMTIGE